MVQGSFKENENDNITVENRQDSNPSDAEVSSRLLLIFAAHLAEALFDDQYIGVYKSYKSYHMLVSSSHGPRQYIQ